MVQVSFFDNSGEEEVSTCNYTRLKDGFLILVGTGDPGTLRERILPASSFSSVIVKSKMSVAFKQETQTEVSILYTDGVERVINCEFAKVKEGFFVITTKERKEKELYSIQQIVPANRISRILVNSRIIVGKE